MYICSMKETTTIFGLRAVIEAIQTGKSIDKIYIQKGLGGQLFQEMQQHISAKDYNISSISRTTGSRTFSAGGSRISFEDPLKSETNRFSLT